MAARKAKSKESPGPDKVSSGPKVAASRTKSAKTRRRYSDAERQRILETARREGLSGPKAAKRFGISTLTFYNWRKKSGGRSSRRRAKPTQNGHPFGNLTVQLREAVRAKVREILPGLIEQEVGVALGGTKGRR